MPVRGRKIWAIGVKETYPNLALIFYVNLTRGVKKNRKMCNKFKEPRNEAQKHRFLHSNVKVGEFLRGNFSTLIGGTCHMINLVFEKPSFKASFR